METETSSLLMHFKTFDLCKFAFEDQILILLMLLAKPATYVYDTIRFHYLDFEVIRGKTVYTQHVDTV